MGVETNTISETGFYPCVQVEATQFGLISRESARLQTVDSVQKHYNCINIPT
jgi:hypothetical protein